MKVLLPAILFFTVFASFGQNVNGHWYGIGRLQFTKQYDTYLSELTLRQKGKSVWGEFQYYFKDSLMKVALNGSFDEQTRKLTIKPFPMVYFMSPNARNSIDCMLSGSFTLVSSKTESVLSGSLVSDDDHKYTVPAINFRFTKSDDTASLVLKDETLEKKKQVVVPAPAVTKFTETDARAEFVNRKKIYTKELEIVNSSIRIELYDNGEIDYDSVSLYLNDKLILPKSMLTHKAIRMTIELDPNLPFNDISMFAENLGMIPPNTAALIIYDGKIRYETMLTSDLSKSATIKLKRKKLIDK